MAIAKRVIIFDLGGVVLDIYPERAFGALVTLGVDKSLLTEVDCLMNKMVQEYDRGTISTDEFFSYIERQLSSNVRELPSRELRQRIGDIWNMIIGDFSLMKLQRIQELKQEGHRVVLLSNTNDGHWDEIEHRMLRSAGCHVDELFDAVYLSYLMKMRKPEKEIFCELLRSEGVDASECIFFDDSVENCDAARSVGIESVCVERNAPWGTPFVD